MQNMDPDQTAPLANYIFHDLFSIYLKTIDHEKFHWTEKG